MPKSMAMVDPQKCHPERCDRGTCIAVPVCPTKTLKQEASYEVPYPLGGLFIWV